MHAVGKPRVLIERRGFTVVGGKLLRVTEELGKEHYAEHSEKPFFGPLVEFITGGPLLAVVAEGPRAIEAFRALAGATDPVKATPGTIRGDFALETAQNIVHASDGPESAEVELGLWFASDELLDYERSVDLWVLPPAE